MPSDEVVGLRPKMQLFSFTQVLLDIGTNVTNAPKCIRRFEIKNRTNRQSELREAMSFVITNLETQI